MFCEELLDFSYWFLKNQIKNLLYLVMDNEVIMKLYRWAIGITIGATIMSMTGEVLASTGCDGVNAGVFNRTNYTPPGSGVLNTQTGFDIGDTINFTVSGLPGSSFQLINGALNTALLIQALSNTPASLSYTVTGGNSDTTLNTYMLVQAIPYEISITATCTPAGVVAYIMSFASPR